MSSIRGRQSGGVHDGADPSERRGGLGESLHGLRPTDVDRAGRDLQPFGPQGLRRCGEGDLVYVGQQYGASGAQAPGHGGPHTPAAGDDEHVLHGGDLLGRVGDHKRVGDYR
jgi:hypothetical protein